MEIIMMIVTFAEMQLDLIPTAWMPERRWYW